MSKTVFETYDVLVIGGGHAGTEAAILAAKTGAKTLLLTQNIDTLGQMSCNPAIGGIGKGHLVKEIDALGGIMGKAADMAGIQFRVLNSKKGPAVRATRAQACRVLYKNAVRQFLETQENLTIFQQNVEQLLIEDHQVVGVVTQMGLTFRSRAVVLTVGTFLAGKIHVGAQNYSAGRAGDPASIQLSECLRGLPFRFGRLKTGTPPRIDGRSVDFSQLDVQPGEDVLPVFSYMNGPCVHPRQVPCHIAYTNTKTHSIIEGSLQRSPLFSGDIEGIGPRYCPSIEDKVVRFKDKHSHQVFIEPEGLYSHELYPNGLSTSLPFDVQVAFIQSMKGFEKAHITRPGYAIEYDFFDPRDLTPSLESQFIKGLFFAGQINGTTGYEEAGAQGAIAGINAALSVQGKSSWTPRRDEAYIGVLIDDLITNGTLEPYRMFTSRAEYRLLLREDNADARLTPKAHEFGTISAQRWQFFQAKIHEVDRQIKTLKKIWFKTGEHQCTQVFDLLGQTLSKETSAYDLLRRPEVTYEALVRLSLVHTKLKASTLPIEDMALSADLASSWQAQVHAQVETHVKYSGYIEKQAVEIERLMKNERQSIPVDFDYQAVKGLSNEVVEKLTRAQPKTIGMASRISGVTPAALSLLLVYLKRLKLSESVENG